MLQIKDLNISHKKDLRTLLEDFSLVLRPGDKAVIIGEEGNGKSTLLKWIYDPDLVSDYAEVSGIRAITGERLGYLPQELPEEDRNKTLHAFFSEADRFSDMHPGDLGSLAARLGLSADFCYSRQTMETLSGGEKIKAQLLRLLIEEPTVLLLDEPSNDIDIRTLEWLETFIAKAGEAILFVSHDEVLIERTANVVIHIELIRRKTRSRYTVRRMSYGEYMAYRESNLRNQEAAALYQRREQKLKEERFRRIRQKVEHDQSLVSRQDPHGGRLLKKKMHAVKALGRRYEREKEAMTEIPETETAMFFKMGTKESTVPAGKVVIDLKLERLMCPDGSRVLAENIALFVRGPEKICILGDNGTGKSTLLKLIAEDLLARKDIRAAYMPQNYEDLLDGDMTPAQFLAKTGGREETARIRTFLGSMKYTAEEMDHRAADLSGGQKAKLLLLKLSLSGANVLILDEPTRNFSPLSGPVIRQILQEFGGAVISVSHDRKFVEEVCGQVFRLTPRGLVRER